MMSPCAGNAEALLVISEDPDLHYHCLRHQIVAIGQLEARQQNRESRGQSFYTLVVLSCQSCPDVIVTSVVGRYSLAKSKLWL